jgi:Mor family transcriptional regulator
MKYRNAGDILPDKLLKELQRFVSGEVLYVPSGSARKEWGSGSGAREFYRIRNDDIRHKHSSLGADIESLCAEYNLSEDTIRKIVYRKL